MEDHVVHESGQPHWESIAYEVDVVAALSKSFPEFGGDNTASAICWITRNANIHNEGSGCKFRQKWLKKQESEIWKKRMSSGSSFLGLGEISRLMLLLEWRMLTDYREDETHKGDVERVNVFSLSESSEGKWCSLACS